MSRPKDSRHSNRYRGNELMIEKINRCGLDAQDARVNRTIAKEVASFDGDRVSAAEAKRQRRAARRLGGSHGQR